MSANVLNWKKMFWFCLGLALASGFCMKWVESEFISNDESFSIFCLELYLDKKGLVDLFAGLKEKAKTALDYHLHFDFFYMAGVFPGTAAICVLTRERIENKKKLIRSVLFTIASLQLAAWGFDIYENLHLIKWMNAPTTIDNIGFFHLLVWLKFIIILSGLAIAAIAFIFFRKKKE